MEKSNWKDILEHRGVPREEIPALDLYMDQVIRFMEGQLSHLKNDDSDRLLTKTMINNYVKAGIVEKPEKKRYRPSQLMTLIMVFHFKNIISMNHIKSLFSAREDRVEESSEAAVEELYREFLQVQKFTAEEKKKLVTEPGDEKDKTRLVFHLLIEADLNKRMAERLINQLEKDSGAQAQEKGTGK